MSAAPCTIRIGTGNCSLNLLQRHVIEEDRLPLPQHHRRKQQLIAERLILQPSIRS